MLPSESCVWKWKRVRARRPASKALTSGSQLVPSGWMLQMPHRMRAAQALRFERAEHDPAVLQDDRVQGHAEVQVADHLDVAAVVVHDEQLQRDVRIAARRLEAVAVADEDHLAAGQRAGAEVEDAVVEVSSCPSRACGNPSTSRPRPVFGVNSWCVSRTILRVLTWIL